MKYDPDIQETMRFETVVLHLFRMATHDEVIPLTEKVLYRSGGVIEQLPIARRTNIIISDVANRRWSCLTFDYVVNLQAFFRNKDIWREDANIWRPGKSWTGQSGPNVGVWSSLCV